MSSTSPTSPTTAAVATAALMVSKSNNANTTPMQSQYAIGKKGAFRAVANRPYKKWKHPTALPPLSVRSDDNNTSTISISSDKQKLQQLLQIYNENASIYGAVTANKTVDSDTSRQQNGSEDLGYGTLQAHTTTTAPPPNTSTVQYTLIDQEDTDGFIPIAEPSELDILDDSLAEWDQIEEDVDGDEEDGQDMVVQTQKQKQGQQQEEGEEDKEEEEEEKEEEEELALELKGGMWRWYGMKLKHLLEQFQ